MTDAIAAYGSELRWNGALIAEVTNIGGPSLTFDQIDCTHYQSPSHFKEFITGFGDGGEVTMECTLVAGDTLGQRVFLAAAQDKTVGTVTLNLGDPIVAVWTFEGVVIRLDFTQPMDNRLQFTATIKVSGVPALAFEMSTGLSALVIDTATLIPALLTPVFANGTYLYTCPVAAANTTIDATATAAAHTIQYRINSGDWVGMVTAVPSTGIAIGASPSTTRLDIRCWGVGLIPLMYTIYISRPA